MAAPGASLDRGRRHKSSAARAYAFAVFVLTLRESNTVIQGTQSRGLGRAASVRKRAGVLGS